MKTKYPIILVHGIALKDFKFLKSFGEIDRILRIQGYSVYKAKTDGFGSIANNAMQLKEEIVKILEAEGVDKVNIIAHSKGGLDSKYMIENLGMEDYVASLTQSMKFDIYRPSEESVNSCTDSIEHIMNPTEQEIELAKEGGSRSFLINMTKRVIKSIKNDEEDDSELNID
jgi:hypothetical protein